MSNVPVTDRRISIVTGDADDRWQLTVNGVVDLSWVVGAPTASIWRPGEAAETLDVTIVTSSPPVIEVNFAGWPATREPDVYALEVNFGDDQTWPKDRDDLVEVVVRARGGT